MKSKRFPQTALDDVESTPVYPHDEISKGNVCVVAYTVGLGVNFPKLHHGWKPANFNIQWAAVL